MYQSAFGCRPEDLWYYDNRYADYLLLLTAVSAQSRLTRGRKRVDFMKMSAECIRCIVDAQARQAEHMKEEEVKRSYLRRVLGMLSGCGEEVTAPAIVRQIEDLYVQMGGPLQDFTQINRVFKLLLRSLSS